MNVGRRAIYLIKPIMNSPNIFDYTAVFKANAYTLSKDNI
jgi:hypothetical protein